ncbi:hypothetical protein LTR35_015052 [Friedmanniomyces endolithicus]|nr:hypothetical protein LTR35_015052 [Friedmanniomyces endolithicus]KAK0283491.1 hypothetical protein LTS00_011629 [Friedmanniomyces endolithicus]KAK0982931.1 hypothetical protein LTR54_014496 [Friedmanniomyces endolithicus]
MASLPPNNKSGFRAPSRHITTHDEKGASKFLPEQTVPTAAPWQEFPPDAFSSMLYGTTTSPAQLTNDADLEVYTSGTIKPSDIVTKNGTNIRLFDFGPGFKSDMHRTDSIDYSIVVSGTIENEVESGEVRVGKPGDVFVQRGTQHAWRNTTFANDSFNEIRDLCVRIPPYNTCLYVASGHGFDTLEVTRSGAGYN